MQRQQSWINCSILYDINALSYDTFRELRKRVLWVFCFFSNWKENYFTENFLFYKITLAEVFDEDNKLSLSKYQSVGWRSIWTWDLRNISYYDTISFKYYNFTPAKYELRKHCSRNQLSPIPREPICVLWYNKVFNVLWYIKVD